ncbi:MAG: hypothetical protein NUV69_00100 [Candidatus Curtissbacteria bacterium]|nr:hypothetical protein [Candidatus Curtissbacteria bacterium]
MTETGSFDAKDRIHFTDLQSARQREAQLAFWKSVQQKAEERGLKPFLPSVWVGHDYEEGTLPQRFLVEKREDDGLEGEFDEYTLGFPIDGPEQLLEALRVLATVFNGREDFEDQGISANDLIGLLQRLTGKAAGNA